MYILRESKTTSRHSSLYDPGSWGCSLASHRLTGTWGLGVVPRMLRLGRGGVCRGVAARP